MTWEQIESNWKQLKGDLHEKEQDSSGATRGAEPALRSTDLESARRAQDAVEAEFVSYKRSLHRGTAFIRRRKPVPVEQAGWTAAR